MSDNNRLAVGVGGGRLDGMNNARIFRYFKTSPEIIRLVVMMYVRYPLSLRNVEDLLHERGIDITHETVRFRRNRLGTIFMPRSGGAGSRRCGISGIGAGTSTRFS